MPLLPTAFAASIIVTASLAIAPAHAQETQETEETQEALVGDAEKGAKIFRRCAACHKVGEGAKNAVGPILNGIVDAPFGAVEGFKYSDSLLELAAEGRIWDAATLDAYMAKPRDVVPKGKMAFAGLRKPQDRADVIEYLRQFEAE